MSMVRELPMGRFDGDRPVLHLPMLSITPSSRQLVVITEEDDAWSRTLLPEERPPRSRRRPKASAWTTRWCWWTLLFCLGGCSWEAGSGPRRVLFSPRTVAASSLTLSSSLSSSAHHHHHLNKAEHLRQSIQHQTQDTTYHTSRLHIHRHFLQQQPKTPGPLLRPTLGRLRSLLSFPLFFNSSSSSPSSSSGSTMTTSLAVSPSSPSSLVSSFRRLIQRLPSWDYYLRVGLAGGLAGGTGTLLLFPLDAAKTLRQSDPQQFTTIWQALRHLLSKSSSAGGRRWAACYAGVGASVLGAIPSSALYFGAYESTKTILHRLTTTSQTPPPTSSLSPRVPGLGESRPPPTSSSPVSSEEPHPGVQSPSGAPQDPGTTTSPSPWWIHAVAAAAGNMASSAIFVPKELLTKRMQYLQRLPPVAAGSGSVVVDYPTLWAALQSIVREQGLGGLYCGYQATLLRNIPSAALRFVLYEELKRSWLQQQQEQQRRVRSASPEASSFSWRLFAAGAVAGALASGFMTPLDVLKTRQSTGTCPVDVPSCWQHVIQHDGWRALYAGAGTRMAVSGLFSAVGLGTFEAAKIWLGVSSLSFGGKRPSNPSSLSSSPPPSLWEIPTRSAKSSSRTSNSSPPTTTTGPLSSPPQQSAPRRPEWQTVRWKRLEHAISDRYE